MIYESQTPQFGRLLLQADGKDEAASMARRFGDYHGLCRAVFFRLCTTCDSKPCCCPAKGTAR